MVPNSRDNGIEGIKHVIVKCDFIEQDFIVISSIFEGNVKVENATDVFPLVIKYMKDNEIELVTLLVRSKTTKNQIKIFEYYVEKILVIICPDWGI